MIIMIYLISNQNRFNITNNVKHYKANSYMLILNFISYPIIPKIIF